MKKLFFATAIAIGSLTAVNAQSTAIAQADNAEVKQSVEAKQAPVQDFKEINENYFCTNWALLPNIIKTHKNHIYPLREND